MSSKTITISVNRIKFQQTLVVLPTLLIIMSLLTLAAAHTLNVNLSEQKSSDAPASASSDAADRIGDTTARRSVTESFYPASGADLDISQFALSLPPAPLDALPYDVRSPLSNGMSVPVKRRWLWIPPGKSIVVSEDGTHVDIPEGAMWWKEFYVETDRGTFLIERRIIARMPVSSAYPNGWAFYTSHHLPENWRERSLPITLPTTGQETKQFRFQPTDWLPTQSETTSIEVRFEDVRGQQYPYLFPGQAQCTACHNGAAGAYPNAPEDPIFVFGLHPNNLTPESLAALVRRGWITNSERLLTEDYPGTTRSWTGGTASVDDLTEQVVALMRNNCASCHNASPYALASFTALIMDPNYNYSTDEMVELLRVSGRMMPNAHPLVTPGNLEQSEIWLRLNGLDGRRRMPPSEGGLPDLDPRLIDLLKAWITTVDGS